MMVTKKLRGPKKWYDGYPCLIKLSETVYGGNELTFDNIEKYRQQLESNQVEYRQKMQAIETMTKIIVQAIESDPWVRVMREQCLELLGEMSEKVQNRINMDALDHDLVMMGLDEWHNRIQAQREEA